MISYMKYNKYSDGFAIENINDFNHMNFHIQELSKTYSNIEIEQTLVKQDVGKFEFTTKEINLDEDLQFNCLFPQYGIPHYSIECFKNIPTNCKICPSFLIKLYTNPSLIEFFSMDVDLTTDSKRYLYSLNYEEIIENPVIISQIAKYSIDIINDLKIDSEVDLKQVKKKIKNLLTLD